MFQLVEQYLPLPFMNIRTKEIDTMNDYERAVKWEKMDIKIYDFLRENFYSVMEKKDYRIFLTYRK